MKQKYLMLVILFMILLGITTPLAFSATKLADDDQFIVIFREWSDYNKQQVLSVEGVQFIKDTTFGDQGAPAIIISAKQPSIDRIMEFNFVYNVQPIVSAIDPMPKSISMDNSLIISVIAIILLIIVVLIIKKIKT